MTRDDIIRMAREAYWQTQKRFYDADPMCVEHSAQFYDDVSVAEAALAVAAAEREACAKVCEEYQDAVDRHRWPNGYECADAIRARGIN